MTILACIYQISALHINFPKKKTKISPPRIHISQTTISTIFQYKKNFGNIHCPLASALL